MHFLELRYDLESDAIQGFLSSSVHFKLNMGRDYDITSLVDTWLDLAKNTHFLKI